MFKSYRFSLISNEREKRRGREGCEFPVTTRYYVAKGLTGLETRRETHRELSHRIERYLTQWYVVIWTWLRVRWTKLTGDRRRRSGKFDFESRREFRRTNYAAHTVSAFQPSLSAEREPGANRSFRVTRVTPYWPVSIPTKTLCPERFGYRNEPIVASCFLTRAIFVFRIRRIECLVYN